MANCNGVTRITAPNNESRDEPRIDDRGRDTNELRSILAVLLLVRLLNDDNDTEEDDDDAGTVAATAGGDDGTGTASTSPMMIAATRSRSFMAIIVYHAPSF